MSKSNHEDGEATLELAAIDGEVAIVVSCSFIVCFIPEQQVIGGIGHGCYHASPSMVLPVQESGLFYTASRRD